MPDIFDQIATSPPPQGDIFDAIAPGSAALRESQTPQAGLRPPNIWERMELASPRLFGQQGTQLQPEQPTGVLPAVHSFLTTAPPQFSYPQDPSQQTFTGNLGNALGRQLTPLNAGMAGVGIPGLAAAEALPAGTAARTVADLVKVIFAAQGTKGAYDVAKTAGQGIAAGQPVGPTLGTAVGDLPMNLLMMAAPFLAKGGEPQSGLGPGDVQSDIKHEDVLASGGAATPKRPSGTPGGPSFVGEQSTTPINLDQSMAQMLMDTFQRNMIVPGGTVPSKPPVEPSGGEVSFRGQGVPNARQQGFEQPRPGEPVLDQPQQVTGPTAPFQRTSPLTQEQQLAQQRKANVERGLTDPSGYYVGSEEVPYAKEGQFPQEGGPAGTLSALQRQRMLAGQTGVRSGVANEPPFEPMREPGSPTPIYPTIEAGSGLGSPDDLDAGLRKAKEALEGKTFAALPSDKKGAAARLQELQGSAQRTPEQDVEMQGLLSTDAANKKQMRDEWMKQLKGGQTSEKQTAQQPPVAGQEGTAGAATADTQGSSTDVGQAQGGQGTAIEPGSPTPVGPTLELQSGLGGPEILDHAIEKIGDSVAGLKDLFSDERLRAIVMKQSGVSVPKTTAKSEAVGNQLTMFAQASGVAQTVARSMATDVLGPERYKDKAFSENLGAVLVEEQLRTKGATLIGRPDSPLRSEAQYRQLLNSPAIRDAIQRHKDTIQPLAQQMHEALGGKLRRGGEETGAFVNLRALLGDEQAENLLGGKRGDLTATLQKGTRFGKEFKGTAERYDLDYRHMAERMVEENWVETERRKLGEVGIKNGLIKVQRENQRMPDLGGQPHTKIPVVVQRGLKNETWWVPQRYAEEFTQAFQTDSPLQKGLLSWLGGLVTKAQTSLGADAAFHVGSMGAALLTAPEKVTAFKYAIRNVGRVLEDSPDVQREIARMAKEAGIVREGEAGPAEPNWKKLVPGQHMITFFYKVSRLTLDQLYKDAVARGESPDNPVWRRAAVQGALGEYNKRLLTKYEQIFKESGMSPFLVAGKTFNKLSLRQLAFSPGRKAADMRGGAQMRLRQALYAGALVIATPLVMNTINTGSPMPPGVDAGQFAVGKNKDGSYKVVDVAQLLMMRRGIRISGVQALTRGLEDKQSAKQIATQMGGDIVGGITHPYTGPAVDAGFMLAKGESLSGYRHAKDKSDMGSKAKEAVKMLNPTVETLLPGKDDKTLEERALAKFGRVGGVKVTPSNLQRIVSLARQFKQREGVPLGEGYTESPYRGLVAALRGGDATEARKAYNELLTMPQYRNKPDLVNRYFRNFTGHAYTGEATREEKFKAELSAEDRKVYDALAVSNEEVEKNYYNIILGQNPPQKRQPRAPRFSIRQGAQP